MWYAIISHFKSSTSVIRSSLLIKLADNSFINALNALFLAQL